VLTSEPTYKLVDVGRYKYKWFLIMVIQLHRRSI